MDLSEIPHEQWDYSVRQLTLLNFSEEEDQEYNSIYESEILDVNPLQSQLNQTGTEDGITCPILGKSSSVCTSLAVDRFYSFLDWSPYSGGYNMDVASERSICIYLDNGDTCQLEQEPESIMQLALEYSPEFVDSTALQVHGTPAGTTSNCGLENTPWDIVQMEGSHGADIFSVTTSGSEYGTVGATQFVDFPPTVSSDLYQVSVNEWLMSFTNAGLRTSEIPGSLYSQNDTSLWTSPSQEYTDHPNLALTNGHYAGEMEPELSCSKEEEKKPLSRKNKRNHRSGNGEERYYVQRRKKRASQTGERTNIAQRRKRSSHLENGSERKIVQRRKRESQFATREEEISVRRSERVRGPPPRYMDEWCRPKARGKITKKKAALIASRGFGSVESSSLPGSSTVYQLEDATKTESFMSRISSEVHWPLAVSWEAQSPSVSHTCC